MKIKIDNEEYKYNEIYKKYIGHILLVKCKHGVYYKVFKEGKSVDYISEEERLSRIIITARIGYDFYDFMDYLKRLHDEC